MNRHLLISACVLALAASSAAAAPVPWAGSVNGDYGNLGGRTLWDANGAVQVPLDWMDLSLQGTFGATGVGPIHQWDGGGNLVWNGSPDFRLAFTAIYNNLGIHGFDVHETQLGGGLEWYPMPWLTVSGQGGALVGTDSGGYVGGTLKGYILPDLSVSGNINYTSLTSMGVSGHITGYGAKAEWLPCESLPVSVTGSYTHLDFGGGGGPGSSTDSWTIGLKLYLNEAGQIPLVQHNRTGTLDTIGSPISAAVIF